MSVDTGVGQARILITLKFEDSIVHQRSIKHSKRTEHIEIFHTQTGHLLEQSRLQLSDNIFQATLSVVREIHKDRYARRKLYQLLLYLLTLTLHLLLLSREFLLLLVALSFLFRLCLLYLLRLIDDSSDVLIEIAETLYIHQRLHCFGVIEQTLQCVIIHIDQQCRLPSLGKQRSRRTCQRYIEHILRIDLLHAAAIICQHRQELDKLTDFGFGIRLVDIESAAIVRNLTQSSIEGKVEDIALMLHNGPASIFVFHLPRTLHAECRLKIGLRTLQIAKHEDTGPRLHSHPGRQLTASQRDSLRHKRVAHIDLHRSQRIESDACRCPGTHRHFVVVIESVLSLSE